MSTCEAIESRNLNADHEFPLLTLVYKQGGLHPRNPGYGVMHWHDDVQVLLVDAGSVKVHTLGRVVVAAAGEGVIIGVGVPHRVEPQEPLSGCRYLSLLLPPAAILSGSAGPARRALLRVIDNAAVPFMHLSPDEPWGRRALAHLCAARERAGSGESEIDDLGALRIVTELLGCFCEVAEHREIPDQGVEMSLIDKRMRPMLAFIAAHFADKISLSEIASAANVSASECLRCFHASLATTPHRYLMDYRLNRAADMLLKTDETVASIARAVGFRQANHMGKLFRERYGLAPRAWRQANRGA